MTTTHLRQILPVFLQAKRSVVQIQLESPDNFAHKEQERLVQCEGDLYEFITWLERREHNALSEMDHTL